METRSSTTVRKDDNDVVRRTVTEERVTAARVPTKAFRLKAGARHFHDGVAVQAGDVVHLTQDQARAFRDKFEPADDSDFKVEDQPRTYTPNADNRGEQQQKLVDGVQEGQNAKGVDKTAETGLPVPQPPVVVPDRAPAVQQPHDVTALDPAKQGQQSREQRQLIDSGMAPPPKSITTPSEDKTKTSTVPVGGGAAATGAGGKATQPGGQATRSGAPSGAATGAGGGSPATPPATAKTGATAASTTNAVASPSGTGEAKPQDKGNTN